MLNEMGRIAEVGGWEMDLITRRARWTKGTYDIVEIGYGDPIPGPDEHVSFYLPEYRPVVEGAMKRLIEDDIALKFEAKLRTTKGNIKWCRALGKAVRKDGVCIRVYGTFQNITERKRAEEKIQQLNVELEQRGQQGTGDIQLLRFARSARAVARHRRLQPDPAREVLSPAGRRGQGQPAARAGGQPAYG
jgi:hypothetical protein